MARQIGPDAGRGQVKEDLRVSWAARTEVNAPQHAAVATGIAADLVEAGWIHLSVHATDDDVLPALSELGDRLGMRASGRAAATLEVVAPRTVQQAHPRSLSSLHGLGSLPLHVELSHRVRPCRYVLLGCLDPGAPGVATTLLDRRTLDLTADETALLKGAPVLVRSGRRSFYSTIMPADGEYLRYDQACMEPVDERGRAAMRLVEERLARCPPERHDWRAGDILIIDNWRVLHGRASASAAAGRRLARILVDA